MAPGVEFQFQAITEDFPTYLPMPNIGAIADWVREHGELVKNRTLEAVGHAQQYIGEHPQEAKIALISIGIVVGVIVLAASGALSVILSTIAMIVRAIVQIVLVPFRALVWVVRVVVRCFTTICYLMCAPLVQVAVLLLHAVGFGANGVIARSFAASVQSVVYGAFTKGFFSVLQALGATLGRPA